MISAHKQYHMISIRHAICRTIPRDVSSRSHETFKSSLDGHITRTVTVVAITKPSFFILNFRHFGRRTKNFLETIIQKNTRLNFFISFHCTGALFQEINGQVNLTATKRRIVLKKLALRTEVFVLPLSLLKP